MSTDRSDLGYWHPLLERAGVPVPRTQIVTTAVDLYGLLDGAPVPGFDEFLAELGAAAEREGYPCFLRTGHGSGKHEWRDTCYLAEPQALAQHVYNLTEWSACADLLGMPCTTWAVRELLDAPPLFTCRAYRGFPATREFRVFIRDDEIEHVQPYWPPAACEQGEPDVAGWRVLLEQASRQSEDDAEQLGYLAGLASGAVGGGYWSVDCLQVRSGEWYVIDMAAGEASYRWDPAA